MDTVINKLNAKQIKQSFKGRQKKGRAVIQFPQHITPLQFWSFLHCQYLLAQNTEP